MSNKERSLEVSSASLQTEQRSLMAHREGNLPLTCFVETKEYRRFVQACEAARRYWYIVVCVGERGVGKTWAARRYAQWDLLEPLLSPHSVSFSPESPIPRTAFYTPKSTVTPKKVEQDLAFLRWGLQMIADHGRAQAPQTLSMPVLVRPDVVNLLIVDEVDGLSSGCLSVLRDVFDQDRVSLVLLGRSGCAERLLNEDALASRVGVLHTFGTLERPDTRKLLEQQLQGMKLVIEDEAVEVFIEKTRGNFQAMRLVLDHIHLMVDRHGAFPVTGDVIEEAVDRLFTKRNVQRWREKR